MELYGAKAGGGGRASKGFRGRGPVALRGCSHAPGRRTSLPGLAAPIFCRVLYKGARALYNKTARSFPKGRTNTTKRRTAAGEEPL